MVCLHEWVDSAKAIERLILDYAPDLVKVNVEGAEEHLLTVHSHVLRRVSEWLVECHSNELRNKIGKLMMKNGFRVDCIEHGDLKIVVAKIINS